MEWYYAEKRKPKGPVSEAELRARIARGEVGANDLVWCDGMEQWQPVAKTSALAGELRPGGPPPAREVEAEVVSDDGSPYRPPQRSGPAGYPEGTPPPPEAGKATASLVTGICGIVFSCVPCVGLILGIIALVFGIQVLDAAKTRAELAPFVGRANAGKILGIIALVLNVLNSIAINVSQSGGGGG